MLNNALAGGADLLQVEGQGALCAPVGERGRGGRLLRRAAVFFQNGPEGPFAQPVKPHPLAA